MTINLQQSIFEQLGLEDLPDETKLEILSKATELVLKRTMLKVGDRLEQLHLPEIEQQAIINAPTDEERFAKIQPYVPDMETIIEQEIATVRAELGQ